MSDLFTAYTGGPLVLAPDVQMSFPSQDAPPKPAVPVISEKFIAELCDRTHANNVARGWWSNIKLQPTLAQRLLGIAPDTSILATRNRGELMMLVVSELAEAEDGVTNGLMDDKLPHLFMFDVEMADTAIRLLDMIGAERSLHGCTNDFAMFDIKIAAWKPESLMDLVCSVSMAMEHHRKGRIDAYRTQLVRTLAGVIRYAADNGVNIFEVIEAKDAFNATREDHQIANRMKDGGKAY
jgi:hypothetical protein